MAQKNKYPVTDASLRSNPAASAGPPADPRDTRLADRRVYWWAAAVASGTLRPVSDTSFRLVAIPAASAGPSADPRDTRLANRRVYWWVAAVASGTLRLKTYKYQL